MAYSIHYYSEDVQETILELPATLLARYISLTTRMEAAGANLGEPQYHRLWERRIAETRMKEVKNADA